MCDIKINPNKLTMDIIDKEVKKVKNEICDNFLDSLKKCLINFESEFEVKKRSFPETYFDLNNCFSSYSTFTQNFIPFVELHMEQNLKLNIMILKLNIMMK